MLRTRLTLLALLLPAGLAHAGIENAGTTAGNFLSVGTGAGILSMGGATLGAGRDLNAVAWNPATLGFLSSSQYALSHASLALDVSQDWVAASGRLGRSETRWAASALYQNDGSFDGRDAFGAPTGAFNVSNLALGVGVARPFTPDVTAGARFHLVNESLGSASGSGFGMDLGLQARRGAFGFGAAARNLGGKMKYDSGSYDLPGVFGFGASWSDDTRGLRLALDANFPHAYYNDVRFGGEWMWQQRVALRAGYRLELGAGAGEPLGGPSFGFGTGVNGLWFDYAFLAGSSQAQGEHRFGLTFHPSFFRARGGHGPMTDESPADTPSAPVAAAPEPAPAPPAVAKPAPPAVAAQPVAPAVAKPAPPAVAVKSASPGAAPVAPPIVAPKLALADDDTDSRVARHGADAPVANLKPSPAVKVPRLSVPKLDAAPVAAAPAPVAKPAKAAPVADAPAASPAPPVAKLASTPAPTVVVVKPAPKPEKRPDQVVVKEGESMEDIAKRWGTSVPAIMMENNLVKSSVRPGQKLRLPKH